MLNSTVNLFDRVSLGLVAVLPLAAILFVAPSIG